jgi:DNA-binding transcriptional ArsR family regulator
LTDIYILITLMSVYMPTATPALTEDAVTEMLRAIADPVRRRILEMLKQPGCCSIDRRTGLCACDIEREFRLSQPTISHHMAVLRDAGLIESEKVGQWMWYRRNETALRRLARSLGDAL